MMMTHTGPSQIPAIFTVHCMQHTCLTFVIQTILRDTTQPPQPLVIHHSDDPEWLHALRLTTNVKIMTLIIM